MQSKHIHTPFVFLIMIFIIVLGGCKGVESDSNKNEAEIIEKVREFGVNYFKERYDADVEFTEFNVRPPHIDRSVGMQGHIVGDEEQHIYLLVNYVTYEVIMGTAPVGFTDSHPNLKEDSVN